MKKVIVCILLTFCLTNLIACHANNEIDYPKAEGSDTAFSNEKFIATVSPNMKAFESWISEKWPSVTDFKVLFIHVDLLDEPQHSKCMATIKASYTYNGKLTTKLFSYDISYHDFQILYENHEYLVYNVETEGEEIVTDINSESINVLKKIFKPNWQDYQSAESNQLLAKGNVIKIDVSSLPESYNDSFDGEDAQAITNYLSSLNLESSFEEDPDEYTGMTWVISLKYEGGDTVTVYHFGNAFIRADQGPWYKMTYEEASRFESLLKERSK